MKAILVNEDKTLRWDDVADPVLGTDDCLVKIEAAAVNRADLMQREGDYPPPPGSLRLAKARKQNPVGRSVIGFAPFWVAAVMPSMPISNTIC